MRCLALCSTVLLGTLLAQPVMASDWYKYQLNTDDSLSWRDPSHALKLHSDSATGITVSKTSPDSLWGMQQGDVIVAVDDHPVQHVSELLARLRASKPAAVNLHLRRGDTSLLLALAAADYASIVDAEPPTPPSAPTPPVPPAPPSGG
jgi:PDZ domain